MTEKIQIHNEKVKYLFLELMKEYEWCETVAKESHKRQMDIIRQIIDLQQKNI